MQYVTIIFVLKHAKFSRLTLVSQQHTAFTIVSKQAVVINLKSLNLGILVLKNIHWNEIPVSQSETDQQHHYNYVGWDIVFGKNRQKYLLEDRYFLKYLLHWSTHKYFQPIVSWIKMALESTIFVWTTDEYKSQQCKYTISY